MVSGRRGVKRSCLCLLVASVAAATASSHAPPLACDQIRGPDRALETYDVVLLRELHGTREIPHFVASPARFALNLGRSVTLPLEIPREEKVRLHTYLLSP